MKKILIPILSMAAVAPVATSVVACSNSLVFKLNFTSHSKLDTNAPAFELDNIDIVAGKEYTINIDLSEASDEALEDWADEDSIGLACAIGAESAPEVLVINPDKCKVILNEKDVTSECEIHEIEDVGAIALLLNQRTWKKSDKVTYKMVWTVDKKDAYLAFTAF